MEEAGIPGIQPLHDGLEALDGDSAVSRLD
jgi:hypothetical protein